MGRTDLVNIRLLILHGRYLIKTHARKRIAERGIRESEVIQVILKGSIVEETPDAKPFPKCLIMHFLENDEPLYVSCASDGQMVYINNGSLV